MNTTEQDSKRRKVVVGDIHGELEGFRAILMHAGLINDRDKWTGGNTILIQTGDVIDRGPYSVETVSLLRKLQKEAPLNGGMVVRLCGNHELMLMQGDWRYANFAHQDKLASEIREEISMGDILAAFTDGVRLYSHAGLRSVARDTLVEEMTDGDTKYPAEKKINIVVLVDHINQTFKSLVEESFFDHILCSDNGIFWNRGILGSEGAGIFHQVFGHTPTRENNFAYDEGLKLINIDTGMFKAFGGNIAYLDVTENGGLTQWSKAGKNWRKTILLKKTATKGLSDMRQRIKYIESKENFRARGHGVEFHHNLLQENPVAFLEGFEWRDRRKTANIYIKSASDEVLNGLAISSDETIRQVKMAIAVFLQNTNMQWHGQVTESVQTWVNG